MRPACCRKWVSAASLEEAFNGSVSSSSSSPVLFLALVSRDVTAHVLRAVPTLAKWSLMFRQLKELKSFWVHSVMESGASLENRSIYFGALSRMRL
ncbi:hypothetical protein KC19_1G072900 [Ceratodon purpureus]|uniref:Uncharacterized protein n=1 Tax=Ceratodon purpureus TaxID=3225 RepID=A0A8T0J3I1_CERPU|nr:hypothetical protein KC19_1G072900 [Ceratodon purpureus]